MGPGFPSFPVSWFLSVFEVQKPAGVTGRVHRGTGPGSKFRTLTKPVPSRRGYRFQRVFPWVFEAAAQAFILDFSISYCSFVIYFNL